MSGQKSLGFRLRGRPARTCACLPLVLCKVLLFRFGNWGKEGKNGDEMADRSVDLDLLSS